MRPRDPLFVVCLILIFAAASGVTACNRENGVEAAREGRPLSLSQSEQEFMVEAAQDDLGEIDMAQIALHNSSTNDVTDFANMIKSDHTNALDDLAELMQSNNVQIPKSIPVQTERDITRMTSLKGGEFDREFVNMIVGEHQKSIEMFRDQRSTAQHPDLKKYVENMLPILEMHLEKAQRLQTKLFSVPNRESR